jgi:hypothetical protein
LRRVLSSECVSNSGTHGMMKSVLLFWLNERRVCTRVKWEQKSMMFIDDVFGRSFPLILVSDSSSIHWLFLSLSLSLSLHPLLDSDSRWWSEPSSQSWFCCLWSSSPNKHKNEPKKSERWGWMKSLPFLSFIAYFTGQCMKIPHRFLIFISLWIGLLMLKRDVLLRILGSRYSDPSFLCRYFFSFPSDFLTESDRCCESAVKEDDEDGESRKTHLNIMLSHISLLLLKESL